MQELFSFFTNVIRAVTILHDILDGANRNLSDRHIINACDKATGQEAAIKVISFSNENAETYDSSDLMNDFPVSEKQRLSDFKEQIKQIEQEIKLLYKLKGRKNIVTILDHEILKDDNAVTILIMLELLSDFTTWQGLICDDELAVIDMGIQLCNALESCEKLNILHKDIKPENILKSSSGEFKLTDFSAADMSDTGSVSSLPEGTLLYMAPEVLAGNPFTRQSDLYSLGMILYQYVNSNRLPFIDINKQFVLEKDLKNSIEQRCQGKSFPAPVNASPDLAWVIRKACQFNEDNRYVSAKEFRLALIDARKKIQTKTKTAENEKKHGPGKIIAVAAGIALIAIAAAGVLLLKGRSTHSGTDSANMAAIASESPSEIASEISSENMSSELSEEADDNNGADNTSSDTGKVTGKSSSATDLLDEYHVGDSLMYGDLKITYLSAEELVDKDAYCYKEGNHSVAIHLIVQNISSGKKARFDTGGFKCYADDIEYTPYEGGHIEYIHLTPGRFFKCDLYFQIPDDTKKVEFTYEPLNIPDFPDDSVLTFVYDPDESFAYDFTTVRKSTDDAYRLNETTDTSPMQFCCSAFYDSEDQYALQPSEGYHFMSFDITYTNCSSEEELADTGDLLLFADGEFCTWTCINDDLITETLAAGRKAKGSVTFIVPDNYQYLEMVYFPDKHDFPDEYAVIRITD